MRNPDILPSIPEQPVPIQAIIFDLDGLIVDTEALAYQSWVATFREYGVALPRSAYQLDIGTAGKFDSTLELERLTGKHIPAEQLVATRMAHREQLLVDLPLLPGVLELVTAAHAAGWPLAVASSSNRVWVEGWLERLGIRRFFQCVRTRDDVAQIKPAPELFLAAAACLGIAPEACLVLEDSPPGMFAAAAAGMRCIAVPNALTIDLPRPPVALTLGSLSELTLARLGEL